MRSLLHMAFCALALLLSLPASAQSEGARARALFVDGQAEYNLGHFGKALEKYEAAYKIKAVPALLFNIAQCHRQLGDMREAATTYKGYLRTANEKDPNRSKAEALLAEVESAIATQAQAQGARPLGSVPDAEGGKQAAATDHDGPPQIEASAEEKATASAAAATGASAPLAANDQPPAGEATHAVPAAALETTAVPPQKSSGRTWTWVAAGGTAAALAGGVLFGLKSKSAASDLQGSHHPSSQVDKLQSDASSSAGKANLLFAVGVGLAAVTATFFVLKF